MTPSFELLINWQDLSYFNVIFVVIESFVLVNSWEPLGLNIVDTVIVGNME